MPLLDPKPDVLRPTARPEAPAPDRVPDDRAHGTPQPLRGDLIALLGADKVLTKISDHVRYASDASPYRFVPRVVVVPEGIDDVSAVLSLRARQGSRGGVPRSRDLAQRPGAGRGHPRRRTQALDRRRGPRRRRAGPHRARHDRRPRQCRARPARARARPRPGERDRLHRRRGRAARRSGTPRGTTRAMPSWPIASSRPPGAGRRAASCRSSWTPRPARSASPAKSCRI